MRVGFFLNNMKKEGSVSALAYTLSEALNILNVEVIFFVQRDIVDIRPKHTVVLNSKNDLARATELNGLYDDYKLDAILGFMKPMSNVLGISKIFKRDMIAIGSIHNNDNALKYNKLRYIPNNIIQRYLFNKLNKIIAVSEAVKKDIVKAFNINENHIEVIYNPIDLEGIRLKSNQDIPDEEKHIFEKDVFINIGRLQYQKGQWHLLNIFKGIYEYNKNINLVILGEGELKQDLIKLSKDLGISDSVYLLGFKENPYKYLKRSKLFLLSSLYEGFGLVITEAMALGVPVIAFNTEGGHTEIITKGGILVDYPNEELFKNKCIELLEDKEKYNTLSKEALERANDFRPNIIAKRYLDLIKTWL